MSATTSAVQHCDTNELNLDKGDHVVVELGVLKGLEGILTDLRGSVRVLIALGRGVYVELPCTHVSRCN